MYSLLRAAKYLIVFQIGKKFLLSWSEYDAYVVRNCAMARVYSRQKYMRKYNKIRKKVLGKMRQR